MGTQLRAHVQEVDALVVLGCSGRPRSPWMNQVVVRERVPAEALDEALALLADAEVHVVVVPQGVDLAAPLAERGFAQDPVLLRMAAPAGGPGAQGWRVEVVGPERAEVVAGVCEAAFGLPEPAWWTSGLGRPGRFQLLAYDGDTPVATAAMHVHGDVAHIGAAGTVPAHRGRGAQAALLAARLRLAADAGAALVGVKCEEGGTSYRNLLRAGFALSETVTHWRRDTRADPAG